jgi:hypothetical protein
VNEAKFYHEASNTFEDSIKYDIAAGYEMYAYMMCAKGLTTSKVSASFNFHSFSMFTVHTTSKSNHVVDLGFSIFLK